MKWSEFTYPIQYNLNDFITQDRYYNFCLTNPEKIQYTIMQRLDDPGEWRGVYQPIFEANKSIIVSGHCDKELDEYTFNKYDKPFIIKWFSTNASIIHPKVIGLPHGLTNDCDDTPLHRILGNLQIFDEVLKQPHRPTSLVYMNFAIHTNWRVRQPIWDYFSNFSFITRKQCVLQNYNLEDRKNFLNDLYNSKFVICPEGNGIDTVRMWEALYCRCIPIVKRNTALRYFEGLPILWIEHWNEVTNPEKLERIYNEMMQIDWDFEKLKIGYWIELIRLSTL